MHDAGSQKYSALCSIGLCRRRMGFVPRGERFGRRYYDATWIGGGRTTFSGEHPVAGGQSDNGNAGLARLDL